MNKQENLLKEGISASSLPTNLGGKEPEKFPSLVKNSMKKQVAFLISFVIIAIALGGSVFAYVQLTKEDSEKTEENQRADDSKDQDQEEIDEQGKEGIDDQGKLFSLDIVDDTLTFVYDSSLYASIEPEEMISFPFVISVRTAEDINAPLTAGVMVNPSQSAYESIATIELNLTDEEKIVQLYTTTQSFMFMEDEFETVKVGEREVVRAEGEYNCDEECKSYIAYGIDLRGKYFIVMYGERDEVLR